MRPRHGFLRSVATLALLTGAMACADLPVEPGGANGRPGSFDVEELASAALLVCPTEDAVSARAIIGPEGGSVGVRGSSISIPAGAVAEPTRFEVVVPVSRYMKVEFSAVGQSHYEFKLPATITINYARCTNSSTTTEEALTGAYLADDTDQVLELLGGTVDKTGHKLSFSTSHLSGYAVAY
jgi:hypothetical protein